MATSRRIYESVASHFKAEVDDVQEADELTEVEKSSAMCAFRALAERMAIVFKADNSRFDKDKFLRACGLED